MLRRLLSFYYGLSPTSRLVFFVGLISVFLFLVFITVLITRPAPKPVKPEVAVGPGIEIRAKLAESFLGELTHKYDKKFDFSWEKPETSSGALLIKAEFVVPTLLEEICRSVVSSNEKITYNMDKVIPVNQDTGIYRIAFSDKNAEVLRILLYFKSERQYEENPPEPVAPGPEKSEAAGSPAKRQIVLIIDDFGYDYQTAEMFLDLPDEIVFAVLPLLPYSKRIADLFRKQGRFLLLHMPMEPENIGIFNPGPGALLVSDTPETILSKINDMLGDVGTVGGVNNHMGSRLTGDPGKIEQVLRILSAKGLPFLNSRTTGKKAPKEIASRLGLIYAERDVFLDDELDPDRIRFYFRKAVKLTQKKSPVVVIGHTFQMTYDVLKEELKAMKQEGVELVSMNEILGKRQK